MPSLIKSLFFRRPSQQPTSSSPKDPSNFSPKPKSKLKSSVSHANLRSQAIEIAFDPNFSFKPANSGGVSLDLTGVSYYMSGEDAAPEYVGERELEDDDNTLVGDSDSRSISPTPSAVSSSLEGRKPSLSRKRTLSIFRSKPSSRGQTVPPVPSIPPQFQQSTLVNDPVMRKFQEKEAARRAKAKIIRNDRIIAKNLEYAGGFF